MTSTLVHGGNVQSAAQTSDTKTVAYNIITRHGASAGQFNRFLKLAKEQGLTITSGSYKFSRWTERVNAFNIEFSGPRDVVTAFENFIDGDRRRR